MEKESGLKQIEDLTREIEKETDFERVVELFASAAGIIKDTMEKSAKAKGKLLEIIRDLDDYIEREVTENA